MNKRSAHRTPQWCVMVLVLFGLAGCTTSATRAVDQPLPPSAAASPSRPGAPDNGGAKPLPMLRLEPVRHRTRSRPAPSSAREGLPGQESSGFVLGQGDVIEFRMFGQPDMATTAFVSAQGTVSLPLVNTIDIGGLTPSQAESRIAVAYRNGGYFQNPQVNVTLSQYRSQQISVLGEVNKPGRYPLQTRTTVLDALAQAGGEKPDGAHVVTIVRNTGHGIRRLHVDLNSLVDIGGRQQPLALMAGDTVYVPQAQRFYIYGEVQRPDAYPIQPGMTVMQAISVGGGLTGRGSDSRIEIRRAGADGARRFRPKLTDRIRADDVIYVKERLF